jgi:predicted acyltransferase
MTTVQVDAQPADLFELKGASRRFLSVDIFRGLCVAGMILVTNPGSYSYVYGPLKHADWNGATPTDMIFPSFLMMAGVSMTFSFAARERRGESSDHLARHVFFRSVCLIMLGITLNLFDLLTLPSLRLPGVLQRIGLCYFLGGILYLAIRNTRFRMRVGTLAATILALLTVYWLLQTRMDVPGYGVARLDPDGNFGALIDRSIFGVRHLWHWGDQMWDPEGLLSTLPATCNLLLGIVVGEWLRYTSEVHSFISKIRLLAMAGFGLMLGLVSLALNASIPINKKIWTPSFMLLSGGFSLVTFVLVQWAFDGREHRTLRRLATPALVFGTNAVLGFALANVLTPLLAEVRLNTPDGSSGAPSAYVFQHLLPWMNPWNASFVYALIFVAVLTTILWPLYRARIFLKL